MNVSTDYSEIVPVGTTGTVRGMVKEMANEAIKSASSECNIAFAKDERGEPVAKMDVGLTGRIAKTERTTVAMNVNAEIWVIGSVFRRCSCLIA